jgi:DNA-directed RNA polymerase subunit RPC12/RpoP
MTLAKCAKCGRELMAPDDGHPYWCTECSYEDELKYRENLERDAK